MERASSDNFMEAMHVRWASAGLTFSGPWSRKDLLQLQRVLTGLSSEELAFLKGTDFHRGGRDPGLSGNYAHSFASGQITYHDTAFRVGQIVGSPAKPHPDWILFHEIGHAISYGADRTAGVRAHEAQHRYDEVVQRATRPGALQDHAMQAELRDASQAVDHAREVVDLGSNLAHFGAGPGHHPAVSTYGETDVDEAFAEAFAMYKTQPEGLRAFDPDLCAYFERGDHVRDWAKLPGGQFEARDVPSEP